MDAKPLDSQRQLLKVGDIVELLPFNRDTPGYMELSVNSLERFIGHKMRIIKLNKYRCSQFKCWIAHLDVSSVNPHDTSFYFNAAWCKAENRGLKSLVQRYRTADL